MMVEFCVYGVAATKGSWRGIATRSGKVAMKADNEREQGWAELVALHARQAMSLARAAFCASGPLRVEIQLYFETPRQSKYDYPPRGDVDKLARSILDALSGVVYADDKQVVQLLVAKHFGRSSRACIRVTTVRELVSSGGAAEWSA